MEDDKILVPITWNRGGTNVMISGTFEEYDLTLLTENQMNESKEKSALLWLRPGIYYYKFIVDGREELDEMKPTYKYQDKLFNLLTVEKLEEENKRKSVEDIKRNLYDVVSIDGLTEFNTYQEQQPEDYPHSRKKNLDIVFNSGEIKIVDTTYNNIQNVINNTVSERSNLTLRNTSLHKNLNKLKSSLLQNRHLFSKNASLNSINQLHNFLELSGNFSINVENVAQNYLDSFQNDNCTGDNFINEVDYSKIDNIATGITRKKSKLDCKNEKFVIIYKIAGDYLVPMKIISEEDKTNLLKLKYLKGDNKNKEILVNKDSIFYQPLSENCLSGLEEISYIKEINELSILKNLNTRVINKLQFCCLKDIFMIFNNKNFKVEECENNKANYIFELKEWFDLKYDNLINNISSNSGNINMILIKNKKYGMINTKEDNIISDQTNIENIQFNLVKEILKFKNIKLFDNYREFYNKIFKFVQYLKLNNLFMINFNENLENYTNFQLYIMYPTQTQVNFLKKDFILSDIISFKGSDRDSDDKKLQKFFSLIQFDNFFTNNNQKFFNEISKEVVKKFLDFLESFYDILKEMNLLHIFKYIFLIILLSFIFANFKNIFQLQKLTNKNLNNNSKSIYEEINKIMNLDEFANFDSNNFTFYSNILIIFVFKFVIDLISIKFRENLKTKSFNNMKNNQNLQNGQVNLCLMLNNLNAMNFIYNMNSNEDEDVNLFNDLIYNKITSSKFEENKKFHSSKTNKNIFKFLQYNFNENITQFLKNLNYFPKELNTILYLEKTFEPVLKFFFDFYKLNLYVNSLNSSIYLRFVDLIQNSNKISCSYLELLETNNLSIKQIWTFDFENFENFITVEENVIELLQYNKFIEYIKFYKGLNDFYAHYTYKFFFQKFLPILEDVDTKFEESKNYTEPIKFFLEDLQKFEDYEENYDIKNGIIKINFVTFQILRNLIKHLYEEKAIIIQKNLKKKIIFNFVKYFRFKVVLIQTIWRNYFYEKISNFNYDKCFQIVGSKYKKKDPYMLKIVRNYNNNLINLNLENKKLKQELLNYQNENLALNLNVSDLHKKISRLENDSNITSSTYALNPNESIRSASKTMSAKNNPQTSSFINAKNTIVHIKSHSKNLYNSSNISNNSSSTSKIFSNESTINIEYKKALENKLSSYKNKYRDLVKVVSEHEKKIEKFHQEIKDILAKYGIKIN